MTAKRKHGKTKPKATFCEPCEMEYNSHPRCRRCGQIVGKYKYPVIIEGYLTVDLKEVTENEHYGGSELINGLCKYCWPPTKAFLNGNQDYGKYCKGGV